MGRIIAMTNHKGGCGKTTSTINLGAALAKMGHTCLLVDLDPQMNLTQSLGCEPYSQECSRDVYSCLCGMPMRPMMYDDNLDLVPSKKELALLEFELVKKDRNQIATMLAPMSSKYEYILIDCPPSLGMLTANALTAADVAYIPLQAQYLALQGVGGVKELIEAVQQELNPELVLGGIFITQYDGRKVLHRNVEKLAAVMYEDALCSTKIRDNVALAEAPTQGQTIFGYAPTSKGAEDYTALAAEIHRHLTRKK